MMAKNKIPKFLSSSKKVGPFMKSSNGGKGPVRFRKKISMFWLKI